MTNGRGTLCSNGSIVTVLAMIAAGCGLKIDNADITPFTMNKWLGENDYYQSDGSVKMSCLEDLGMSYSQTNDITTVK